MGRAAFDEVPQARQTFEAADAALGESLTRLCFEGPEAELVLTHNAQPAILTTSIALLRGLNSRCDVAAGHSLGEYSAHVCAGTLAFEDAVALVRQRGLCMQQAVPVGAGAMAAVLGGERDAIEQACAQTEGIVEPVNFNCPGQIVVAGEADAVTRAGERIKALGAKFRPLPVSAPFHSSMMRPAEECFRPHLDAVALSEPSLAVYANVDATAVHDARAAREALGKQVSRAVRWEEIIVRMLEDGVGLFVEIGPGKALTGMIRRIDKDVARCNVESPADFDATREAIART